MSVTTIALMTVVLWVGLQARCDAYIDPTAGGFLVQLLAPLGALVVSSFIYFRKHAAAFLKRITSRAANSSESAPPDIEP